MFPVAAWCVTLEPTDTQSIDILSEDISSESPPLTTACHVGNDKLIIGCRSGAAYVWDWVSHSMLRSMAGQHMKPIILIAVVTTPVDGASSSGVALLGSEGFQPSIITLCQNGILQQWKAKAMDADATKQWSKVSVAPSSPLRTFRLEVSCIGFGVPRSLTSKCYQCGILAAASYCPYTRTIWSWTTDRWLVRVPHLDGCVLRCSVLAFWRFHLHCFPQIPAK